MHCYHAYKVVVRRTREQYTIQCVCILYNTQSTTRYVVVRTVLSTGTGLQVGWDLLVLEYCSTIRVTTESTIFFQYIGQYARLLDRCLQFHDALEDQTESMKVLRHAIIVTSPDTQHETTYSRCSSLWVLLVCTKA
jgi:hypothetical protein